MIVRIGHAAGDENGGHVGGKAGDQTKKEVCIREYYLNSKGWVVLRCKNAAKRERIARAMEAACKNDNIGYDQNQRSSLFEEVKDKGFDPARASKKVEADCSALVRVCIAYAFGKDKTSSALRTVNLPDTLVKTGLFTKYTTSKYCKSSDYLKRGDILCTPVKGHTVVVLDDGAKANIKAEKTATEKPQKTSANVKGTWKTTASLNIRNGAGTTKNKYGSNKTVLVNIPKGTKVECSGSYTKVGERKWLLVKFTYKDVIYNAFASDRYLKKV